MEPKEKIPVNVLLADDDEDDREFFHEALMEANPNASLKTFEDGGKLMNYLTEPDIHQPDIIFLDINMPCKDGKVCLKEIRSIEELQNTPIVIWSTASNPEDIEETFKNGANLYIPKPLSVKEEVKILESVFIDNWKTRLLKTDKNQFLFRSRTFSFK